MSTVAPDHVELLEPRPLSRGNVSLVFMFSVLVGLAMHPAGLLGADSQPSHTRGAPPTTPRHVEQIRTMAETMVRIASRSVRSDRLVPNADVVLAGLARTDEHGLDGRAGRGNGAAVLFADTHLREALLNLPPPMVG